MTKTRKYTPHWEYLKQKKIIRIEIPKEHQRTAGILVRREAGKDKEFLNMLDELGLTFTINTVKLPGVLLLTLRIYKRN